MRPALLSNLHFNRRVQVNGTIDLRIQLPVSAEFNMDGSIIGLQIDVSSQVPSFCM